jgi:hypothetical protein
MAYFCGNHTDMDRSRFAISISPTRRLHANKRVNSHAADNLDATSRQMRDSQRLASRASSACGIHTQPSVQPKH